MGKSKTEAGAEQPDIRRATVDYRIVQDEAIKLLHRAFVEPEGFGHDVREDLLTTAFAVYRELVLLKAQAEQMEKYVRKPDNPWDAYGG